MGARIKRKKKGPVQAKKIKYDGINFASGLERYMYMALQKAKIKQYMKEKATHLLKGLILRPRATKDNQTVKAILLTAVINASFLLLILLILLPMILLLSVRVVLMNLFQYVGSFLKGMLKTICQASPFINHKTKTNATK